jgi:hypothetical protein
MMNTCILSPSRAADSCFSLGLPLILENPPHRDQDTVQELLETTQIFAANPWTHGLHLHQVQLHHAEVLPWLSSAVWP